LIYRLHENVARRRHDSPAGITHKHFSTSTHTHSLVTFFYDLLSPGPNKIDSSDETRPPPSAPCPSISAPKWHSAAATIKSFHIAFRDRKKEKYSRTFEVLKSTILDVRGLHHAVVKTAAVLE
jgi:hypothetical protein